MTRGGNHPHNTALFTTAPHADNADLPPEIWHPNTAGHCRTCNCPSTKRLDEDSILATYLCGAGHRFYEMAP